MSNTRMIPHPITGEMVSFESLYGPDPNDPKNNGGGVSVSESRIKALEDRIEALENMMIDKTTAAVPQPSQADMDAFIQKSMQDLEDGKIS